MMEVCESAIAGCLELRPRIFRDERGSFVKTFHRGFFAAAGLQTEWVEEYYSLSRKGVLRGMHFQLPPHDHDKLVYCPAGRVLDVVLDLREDSPSYGRCASFTLSSESANLIYLPRGVAHGFYTESDTALMMYKVSSVYAPEHDAGILWSSLDFDWPTSDPIVSGRDRTFPSLASFRTPFRME